jgi:hypothetical protein
MIERQITVTLNGKTVRLSTLDQVLRELHQEADLTGADPAISWCQLRLPDGGVQGGDAEITVTMEW